ncbi:MAG: hypothetical protein HY298_03105 [Verrucomicrobia bacterium]|nr:hypothetical protein [Verrucomicrobiota bacterium]
MSSIRMKIGTIGVLALLLILSLVRLGHWGPIGVKAGDDVLCSKLTLTNGQKFCVVAHRTGEVIDAYHVFLYRVEPSGDCYKFTLGDEDSFWWGCSLRPAKAGGEIEIRAFGQLVAKYVPSKDSVVCLDEKRPPENGRKTSSAVVEKLLSR